MTSDSLLTGALRHRVVRVSALVLPVCLALALPAGALGQTAMIYEAYWTSPVDPDGDGCVQQATLNWDPDVVGSSYATLSVYEQISRRPVGSTGLWTLVLETSPHTIRGQVDTDMQYAVISGTGSCVSFDYKIDIFRTGQPVGAPADFTADSTTPRCSTLAAHREDSPPPQIVTDVADVSVPENSTATFQVKLSSAPETSTTVSVAWFAGVNYISLVSGSSLTFTPGNFDTFQTVTVKATGTGHTPGGVAVFRCTGTNMTPKDVRVTEFVPPPLTILAEQSSVNVPEGGTASFRVKLNKRPDADVVVKPAFFSGDSIISVSPAGQQVTIAVADWDSYTNHVVTLAAGTDVGCSPKQAVIRCTATGAVSVDVTAVKEDMDGNCGPSVATRAFFADNGQNAPDLTRPVDCYSNEGLIWVQITARPNINTSSFAVEDGVPTGWFIDDASTINLGGVLDGNLVKWSPTGVDITKPVILTYQARLLPDAPSCVTFSGTLSCDGVSTPITGISNICVCTFHPADTNGDWRLGESFGSEVTLYADYWKNGFPWATEPKTIPIDYVTRAAYLWKVGFGSGYHYDKTQPKPVCWVPNVGGSLGSQALVLTDAELLLTGGTLTRTVQPTVYQPGTPVHVSIAVTPDASTLVYAVEETPPVGWQVSNINESGAWDAGGGKIKWGLFWDANPRVLTYDATPPAGDSGAKAFDGGASFGGQVVLAGGQTSISGLAASDLDGDGDVDITDFLSFQACFNGPNRPPAQANCEKADLNGDQSVDLQDFLVFQTCFNGPNRPPACQ